MKQLFSKTTDGGQLRVNCLIRDTTNHITITTTFTKKSDNGGGGNRYCANFLGIHIAEQILSKIFKNIERMPNCNIGFDLLCGLNYKIDVKSSCFQKRKPNRWQFGIKQNKIADYFLCLAFDNRNDLNPLHIWLIPGNIINHLHSLTFLESKLNEWSKYEKPIDKVLLCCDKMKEK